MPIEAECLYPAAAVNRTMVLTGGPLMNALVVYESMYGNTHEIADRIGKSMEGCWEVRVVPVAEANQAAVEWADVLIVGAPTHAHGLPSARTRQSAREMGSKTGSDLHLDAAAAGPGVREWLQSVESQYKPATSFDTRADGPALLTGSASKGIARRLRNRGYRLISDPHSFLVDMSPHLKPGELERAEKWGLELCATTVSHEGNSNG